MYLLEILTVGISISLIIISLGIACQLDEGKSLKEIIWKKK